ncbi:zinc-binding dehydrogenase [Pseudarthrobacter sp. fls2-241-R2A-168]|uniref:zinc-dependent alcohol dehydrogenase n=1 Tax=Pseudarthrobacter sp. fls2-241-R2A-168 TaxID=3040304 RepID=UPI0025567FC8|nr:zinc-binding dehydrogenase [Pseudarthrobacter sp. fls2-241-R2A-168]
MATTATTVVYEGPQSLTIRDLPIPEVAAGDLLIEVLMAGVDGSELHIINGELERANAKAPMILGDEIVGRVVQIGQRAQQLRGLQVGDVVSVESRWPCEENCRGCSGGNYFLCDNIWGPTTGRLGYGSTPLAEAPGLWGAYATHVFVPEQALVYRIPEALPLKTALYACSVLANGLRWSRESGAQAGKTVVVVGPGPQGIACVLAASRSGARVVCVGLERDAARLESARKAGAVTTVAIAQDESVSDTIARIRSEVGVVDAVIETAGAPSAKQLAFGVVGTLGIVVNVSIPSPKAQEVDWMSLLTREVTIKNAVSHPHSVGEALALAEQMLAEGLDIGDFVTHVFGLRDVEQAIRVAAYGTSETPVKVALDPTL